MRPQSNRSHMYWDMWSNFLNPSISRATARVDPPQLLHPNHLENSEDGTAIVKEAAEHQSMNEGDSSIKSQRASNDPQLLQLIVAAMTHLLIYMMTQGELWV